jgi:hypothetical protein
MGSVPQSHEPEVAQEAVHEGVPEVGASSPQAKWKGQAESSVHGGSQPQVEGTLVLPKILSGVCVDDDMVGGVTSIKYSDHDVAMSLNFQTWHPKLFGKQGRRFIRHATARVDAVDPWALQHRHHELTGCPTLWEGKAYQCLRQATACMSAWQNLMDG